MARGVRRRDVVTVAAALGLAGLRGARAAARFAGCDLVSQGFGGPSQDAIQKIVFDSFDTETGCHSTQVPLQSAAAFARMRAEAAAPQLDLYQFSGGQQVPAAAEGLAADLGALPNLAGVPAALKDPGGKWVDFAVIAEGILYRTDKVPMAPRSYKDFLRPEFAGHVAFPTITNGYGTDFLVMLARAAGGGEKNIDPGFAAMAKFAANATIFKAASEVPGLFAQGDVWIMPYDSTSAKRCKDAGLPVAFVTPEEGSPASPCALSIAAKSRNVEVAQALVDHFLSPACQTGIATTLQWAPTNAQVKLPDALAQQLPRADQLLTLDSVTMTAQRPGWTERWNREIAH